MRNRAFQGVLGVVLVASLACGGGGGETRTETAPAAPEGGPLQQVGAGEGIRLADGSFTFQLPAGWIAHPNNSQTAKKGVYMYGKVVEDGNGNAIIPSCSFILMTTTTTDVVKLYAQMRLRSPLKVERVFTHRDGLISLPNAVGVKGSFPISADVFREVIVVDALHRPRQLFVEAVCESPSELFSVMEADFRMIIGSMRFH